MDDYRTSHGRELSGGDVEAQISQAEVDRRFATSQLESWHRRGELDVLDPQEPLAPREWRTWAWALLVAAIIVLGLIVASVALGPELAR